MANNIDDLPDDIISYILSFLSIRDTLIARLSSPRWLNLPDSRSVIDINSLTVLGEMHYSWIVFQPKFIEIVNRFLQLWSSNKMTNLIIKYCVDEEYCGEIEKWIAKAFSMKVECIEISVASSIDEQKSIFPCAVIRREYKPHLKRLCLSDCTPSFLDFEHTSWLSKLTTLRLVRVPLDLERMNLICSSASNLEALQLIECHLGELVIDDQLLHLKKLEISEDLMREVRLNCPSLEIFGYCGLLESLKFVHVPVLREAKVWLVGEDPYSFFDYINIRAPILETISITVGDEISPIPPNLASYRLKKLNVVLVGGFDLLSLKYLLNACPCLEELRVKLLHYDKIEPAIGRREDWDKRKHHKLRKVKMEFFYEHGNAVKLGKYILRNAVELEEMEIVTQRLSFVQEYYQSLRLLKEKVNPTARFIVSHCFQNFSFKPFL